MQPIHRPQPGDLARKLNSAFATDRERSEALQLLNSYGTTEFDHGTDRVRIAALYNARGSLERLAAQMELANIDYRDVLASAEYRSVMALPVDAGLGSDAYIAAIQEDTTRYQAWLDL
jgi:hypothetical protein